jgi:hypothetical protein
MNAYRFADLPSNSSVASLVTVLVSAWFLIAAAAILSDPASTYTQRSQVAAEQATAPLYVEAAPDQAIAPQARLTITVVAPRIVADSGATTL